MSKTTIPVKFANNSLAYTRVEINPKSLKEVTIFSEDVFATIDGTRISMKREDYNRLFKNEE